MNFPAELKYSTHDEWIRVDGDVAPAIGTMAYEHGEMAERVWTWGLVGAVIAAVGLQQKKKPLAVGAVWLGLVFGVFAAGWAAVAAHKGGVLVYEHGVGIPEPIPDDNPDIDPAFACTARAMAMASVEASLTTRMWRRSSPLPSAIMRNGSAGQISQSTAACPAIS